jgi:bifunctional non-homologous end joining protein LigD
MPDFIEPQLAKLVSEPPKGSDWVHEIKFDGYRMQAHIRKGKATLRSRKGLDWTDRFREIVIGLEGLPDCIVDGEICALTPAGMPSFSGLQSALSSGRTSGLVFFLFDCLWLGRDDKRPYDLGTRKSILKKLLEEHENAKLRYVEHMETDGAQMFKSACQLKLEGIVSKRLDQRYMSGRTANWLKIKCRPRQEAVIGGWEMNGARLARLLLGAYRDGKFTYIGGAGTGFNEKNAPGILKRLRTIETAKSMFEANKPSRARDKHYCNPELVCEVAFEDWTDSGKLRQASFKGLREDKEPSEVVVEEAT